eukprot:TRINITY_DN77273_c0_g1_i1.p1 TRINITY_DN77273_c0_g1~~TRINITY_DN77273_c0_g1_i1.p1  ORF type:complete len:408 (-),score=54.70 TRINITY_DN77273_c0_g1_i1:90-1313(-)
MVRSRSFLLSLAPLILAAAGLAIFAVRCGLQGISDPSSGFVPHPGSLRGGHHSAADGHDGRRIARIQRAGSSAGSDVAVADGPAAEAKADESEAGSDEPVEEEVVNSEQAGLAITALAGAGIADTAYLTAVKLGLFPLMCPTSGETCSTVLNSPYASLGPIPLAALGVLAYGGVFVLSLGKDWTERPLLWWLIFAMALTSGALMVILLAVLETPCLYCAVSAGISATLLFVAEAISRKANGNSPRVAVLALATAVAAGALRVVTLAPKEYDDNPDSWVSLVRRYKPYHPPVRSTSSEAEIALAKHLAKVGAKCYSVWWCAHCQQQREAFGQEALEFAPFEECHNEKRQAKQFCKDAGVKGYPTWIIDGKQYSGGQPLSKLAEMTGFTEYPASAFVPRSDLEYGYMWT